MNDVMLAEVPVEQRGQILRDSCDQIEERYYTRKFDQFETNEMQKELVNVSIQIAEQLTELADIRAEFKARLKPLEERKGKLLGELKAGGEFVKGEAYKFVDTDEKKTAWYSPEGYKLEERDMRPEERQRNVFQLGRTGTDN